MPVKVALPPFQLALQATLRASFTIYRLIVAVLGLNKSILLTAHKTIPRLVGISDLSTAAPAATALTLHINETSISFPMKPENGRTLQAGVTELLHTFAAKQKAERPQRWKSMEFRLKGNPELKEVEFFEVFCNPNAAATAFDARVLITMRTQEGVQITTEGRLSSLKEDVDTFIEQHG